VSTEDGPRQVALLSGTSARRSGDISLVGGDPPFPILFEAVYPVGDLDGDGAADLAARVRSHYPAVKPDGSYDGSTPPMSPGESDTQVWIYYGTPASSAAVH